ncbi:hypothetical protein GCM10022211_06040 [Sphingomonas humi]|uniref:Tetrapyrrole biosynthesis uroporphyrinogen III synthase domain-containing protein n=2 Tax=Sphingomonas humi TaxID=335630 RepID=A0ABP7RLY1_9SPHN
MHPLFAAETLPWTMPAGDHAALLVTSANAVRLAGALPHLPVHAVGAATAEAAREAGLTIVTTGNRGVGALLETLPDDLRLLHLAGEERILPAQVRQQISSVAVYRMTPLPLPPASLLEGSVAMIHSPAAGRRLAQVSCRRGAVRVAAISEAAAETCGGGWGRIEAADQPNDPALLSLAAKLCEEQAR